MKEKFRDEKFSKPTKFILDKILGIVDEYQARGIMLTLRQLYYQLVARAYIENKAQEYQKVSRIVTKARYNGLIDWDIIEDRSRISLIPYHYKNIPDFLMSMADSYRLDRWEGQEYYLELITEKDALSSVLSPIVYEKYHITFNVVRGYSSVTKLYEMSRRILKAVEIGKKPVILYIGDHDPSGLDMLRDIEERLRELTYGLKTEIVHVALTTEQIAQYNPPPNFAKLTDRRAENYIRLFGRESWEVDALRPDILVNILETAIQSYLDVDLMNRIIEKEIREIMTIKKIAEVLREEDRKLHQEG